MIALFRGFIASCAAVAFFFLFSGCNGNNDNAGCVPGDTRACPCSGGEPDGVQTCADDGDSFGPCGCGGDLDADVDGDADDEPDTQCVGKDDFTPCEVVTEADRGYDICVNQTCVSPGCGDATCNVPGPHFAPPPDGFRDDFVRTEPLAGEPVVLDEATGLTWQGCSAGSRGLGCDEGQIDLLLWEEALDYCESLSWGGHADWRLPDEWELLSIVDFSSVPAIDEEVFPATPVFTTWEFGEVGFWASSTLPSMQIGVFSDHGKVRFKKGNVAFDSNSSGSGLSPGAVRCIRGDPAPHGERFERDLSDEEHPLVTDSVTGLMWQGCARGQTGPSCTGEAEKTNWAQAVADCEDLEWAGYNDWRLPGAKELWSVADNRLTQGPLWPFDPAVFPASASSESQEIAFWSSVTLVAGPPGDWAFALSAHRNLTWMEKTPEPYARVYALCVRDGS